MLYVICYMLYVFTRAYSIYLPLGLLVTHKRPDMWSVSSSFCKMWRVTKRTDANAVKCVASELHGSDTHTERVGRRMHGSPHELVRYMVTKNIYPRTQFIVL